ncbi:MAG: hypothetical protein RSE23_01825 [Clostridia bacterium]
MSETRIEAAPIVMEERGRDIAAPELALLLGGERYVLKFSNRAARIAEDVYADQFGKDLGYYVILQEAAQFKHCALQAIYYGALCAGGADMPWDTFDELFSVASIEGMGDIIHKALAQSMPEPDPKNARPTPRKMSAFHGRG